MPRHAESEVEVAKGEGDEMEYISYALAGRSERGEKYVLKSLGNTNEVILARSFSKRVEAVPETTLADKLESCAPHPANDFDLKIS